jgi:hypothetical protein
MLAKYQESAFAGIPYLKGGDDEYIQFYNNTTVMTNGDVKCISTMVDYTDADNPILRPILVAVTTKASPGVMIAVVDDPSGTVAASTWGRAKIRGCVKANVDGGTTDIVVGDQLKVLNSGTAFTRSTAATVTSSVIGTGVILATTTSAVALEAYTSGTNALKWVCLLGMRSVV